jgi:arylsulfatase A-like enzyme
VQTPVLDRLAAEGVRFSRACSNMPVCTPARGSLLTGCWPQRHRALGNDLPVDPAMPSIARALGREGYACGYAGKWHLGGIPRYRRIPPGPERLGFDDFWAVWNCHHDYFRPKYYRDGASAPVLLEGRYEPEVQTDLVLDWLRDRDGGAAGASGENGGAGGAGERGGDERPFCLFLAYGPPHSPYRPLPPGGEGRYDPAALTLRPNCADAPQTRRDLAAYYAHVSAIDSQIGRLVAYLEATDRLDDTLIVYSADHGTMLDSHGIKYKQWPYEESIGIPLVLRYGARVPAGAVDDRLIGIVDYAPTLLGLLGVPVPGAMQGRNLAPGGDLAAGERPESLFLQEAVATDQGARQGVTPWRGVRTEAHTYARRVDGPWLLFDNVADPYQQRNLAAAPDAAALRDRLEAELATWMARIGDTLEPRAALLERYGLAAVWAEREAHLHQGQNMSGAPPPPAQAGGGSLGRPVR